MKERNNKPDPIHNVARDSLDLDTILNPAGAFAHPNDIVRAPT